MSRQGVERHDPVDLTAVAADDELIEGILSGRADHDDPLVGMLASWNAQTCHDPAPVRSRPWAAAALRRSSWRERSVRAGVVVAGFGLLVTTGIGQAVAGDPVAPWRYVMLKGVELGARLGSPPAPAPALGRPARADRHGAAGVHQVPPVVDDEPRGGRHAAGKIGRGRSSEVSPERPHPMSPEAARPSRSSQPPGSSPAPSRSDEQSGKRGSETLARQDRPAGPGRTRSLNRPTGNSVPRRRNRPSRRRPLSRRRPRSRRSRRSRRSPKRR